MFGRLCSKAELGLCWVGPDVSVINWVTEAKESQTGPEVGEQCLLLLSLLKRLAKQVGGKEASSAVEE